MGFSLSGNTYYTGIKRLQPAEIIKVSKRNISSEKYYVPQYKYDATVKENTELIKNAFISSIEKRLNNYNSVGAALTGGYDSRVTWAVINHLNKKNLVKAFTHGLKESRDITIANKIANKLKLDHEINIFDDRFVESLPGLWEPFVRLTEGLIPVTNAHDIKSWELGKQNYRLLLDSHGGALYRRQFMKVAERRIKNSDSLTDQFFEYVKSPLLNLNLLKDDYKHEAITNSKTALKKYFDSIDHIENTGDKIDLFYIHQLSANRYSLAGNAQMNWVMLAHPFLNLDSFTAVQKIPLRYRKNQYIYRYIVNTTFKKLKSFYLENMGLPAPYFGFTYFRYFPMVYELILQRTIAKKNNSIYKKLSLRKSATDYDLFFRINFKQVEEILLRENDLFFDIIDKNNLEQFLKNAENNYAYKLSALSNLITFKLFLDIF
ncbi:asparagine synthetase B [bacterium BMS3Abin03]|nr:asparagine synthetase B [bacterium BMS3Abin03]